MKKNLFKKVVCAASALTMLSSLAISASAADKYMIVAVTPEFANTVGVYAAPGGNDFSDEERAALLAENAIFLSWEECPNHTIIAASALYAIGQISFEEYDNVYVTIKEGGKLSDTLIEKVSSPELYHAWYNDEDLMLKAFAVYYAYLDPDSDYPYFQGEFDGLYERASVSAEDLLDPVFYDEAIRYKDYAVLDVLITDDETAAPEGSDVLVIPEKVYLAALQIQNSGSGDINGSGALELTDAILLARAVGGSYELSAESRKEADLNGDGAIDGNDLTKLVDKLAGK